MAASSTATNSDGSSDVPPQEELKAKRIKKICIILISFVPAVVLLHITNVILAHFFIATSALFPSKSKGSSSLPPQQKGNMKTKTGYVPLAKEDIDRIRQELEASDPLPPAAAGDDVDSQRSAARVQSVITSTEALLNHRGEGLDLAKQDIDELTEAFESFIERLEQDTRRDAPLDDGATAKHWEEHMPSLRSILERNSFVDLDRQGLIQLFMSATEDLQWLLSADEPNAQKTALFLNVNNALSTALSNRLSDEVDNTACQTSYLALDQGKASVEFTPPKNDDAKKSNGNDANTTVPSISNDTARESDLYALVENIKSILSRRDLTSEKLHDKESIHSPISDEGVDELKKEISPMMTSISKKWKAVLAQEIQVRDYWAGRAEALLETNSISNDEEEELCVSPDLVEGMVVGGLGAFRRMGDLRSSLTGAVFVSVSDDPDKTQILSDEMENVDVPEIDYKKSGGISSPPSSGKSGRKSISYVVDGPLLHQGVVGWIDSFVEAISGYNDHVDALIDWAMEGDEVGSVGKSVADAFSRIVRRIPFPVKHVEQLKRSGILGGRTRILLED